MAKPTSEEAASAIMDAVNNFSFDYDAFASKVCRDHRTLQQNFMRLMIATIRKMAESGYDDRNRGAHDLAENIVKSGLLGEAYLPYI